ncbi:MAG: electron transport complex subunit E [Ruminococcus sp.]|nr:electron transport complex subunit E [Ruminococcus sp.]
MNKKRPTVFDGLLSDNTVLSGLMVISPVIICGDTLKNAEALIYAFSAITFLSVLISSFVPQKLPYALKIILYAVISSLVYIPVKIAAQEFYPESITRIGIYYPLLAVNSLIVFQTEAKFFRMKKPQMILTLIFCILGFDAVILITAFIRELIAYGTINSNMVDVDMIISGLAEPFGGFIFLGLLCGLYRKLRAVTIREQDDARSEKNVSDK